MTIQHAFPHDFRSGPFWLDWDPSKWIILGLHTLGLVTGLRRARPEDMKEAQAYMKYKTSHGIPPEKEQEVTLDSTRWNVEKLKDYTQRKPGCCLVLINNNIVDATPYLGEHVCDLV